MIFAGSIRPFRRWKNIRDITRKRNEIMLSGTALRSMGITRPKEGMRISVTYDTLAQENAQADSAGEEEASSSTENTGKTV